MCKLKEGRFWWVGGRGSWGNEVSFGDNFDSRGDSTH